MSNIIKIENSTITSGTTSLGQYVLADLNHTQVGLPLFKFSVSQPDIEFLTLIKTEVDILNTTIYNTATSYGAAVALYVNGSAYAVPLYKISQNDDLLPQLVFQNPTVVSDLSSTGTYLAVKINTEPYGIPLFNYGSQYPFTSTVPQSAITVNTLLFDGRTNDTIRDSGATYLNPKIKTYNQLIERIKRQLGWPAVDIEICDENIIDFIDQSMEIYTKYTGFTEEYLVFHTSLYKPGCGIQLDKIFSMTPEMRSTCFNTGSASYDYDLEDYRKVADCFSFEPGEAGGINTLFTLEQAMAQQTYFSYMLGNAGFDLITWEILKGWLDTRRKVLAQDPYFRFDDKSQTLRIIPEPNTTSNYYAVIGCRVERPIRDLINERWVGQYALALTKIAVANIRGKFTGVSIFGGGQLNYSDLMSQGLAEKQALWDEITKTFGEVSPISVFVG